ncbi:MAG: PLDc N-terminal domain-containing protein [Lachnospiraceae bacterium]|nr:PLDc N-terminal domain-containing protein [Lachnospiraceae bacterium]
MNTEQFMEYLPLLIPIIIVQFVLLGITLHHILTHDNYKRGTRTLWLVVTIVLMEFVGPILYFVFGREDS